MAIAGQTLIHPGTGEQLTFVRTAADTGGAYVEMDFRVTPGGAPAAPHIHPRSSERFDVHAGLARVRIGNREVELGPGETAEVPAGVPHIWSAAGEEPLRMTVTLAPALTAEGFFEDLFGMAEAGRVDAKGLPSVLAILTILYEHPDVVYLVKPPVPVQKALARVGGPVGKALGVLRPARELRAARVAAAA